MSSHAIRCPNDAGSISEVARRSGCSTPVVRFFWCRYCEELFAFVRENKHPGRIVASFARDRGTGAWRIWKTQGPEREVGLAVAAVSQL